MSLKCCLILKGKLTSKPVPFDNAKIKHEYTLSRAYKYIMYNNNNKPSADIIH